MGLGQRIKAAREFAGMDQTTLAKRAGVPQATLSALESRDSNRSNYAEALIAALPNDSVSKVWVRTGIGDMADTAANILELPPDFSHLTTLLRGVPVRGTASVGDDGDLSISASRGTVQGDGMLDIRIDDPTAYALRIKGMSLFPAIRDGWYLVLQPGRKTYEGEYALLQLQDNRRLIRELLYHRETTLEVLAVNGQSRELFDLAGVKAAEPISAIVPPSRWVPENKVIPAPA